MVLMDPDQVSWLMGQVNAAAAELPSSGPYSHTPPYYVMGTSAFGNTPAATECHGSWRELSLAAHSASLRLRRALEGDGERLEEVLFLFQTIDDEAADEISSADDPLTVISYHVHHNPDRRTGEDNDELRAGQIDQVVNYAAGIDGPVAAGGDDNVTLVPEEQSEYDDLAPEALSEYGEKGFSDVGDVGPTMNGKRAIDHIHARGVAAGEPVFIDGDPSDHDGQAARYIITDW